MADMLCFRALAFGKTEEEVKAELSTEDQGNSFLVKSKIFSGNRPTNSIMIQKISPAGLGECRATAATHAH
jgi:glucose-6-phosphate isomerase